LCDELALLIENLNAVVAAVGNEQSPPRVHRQRVRNVELTGTRTGLAKLLDEFPRLVELQDASAAAVTLRDEDVAARRNEHVVGLIEIPGIVCATSCTKRQQHL